jgi:uncharacterized protein
MDKPAMRQTWRRLTFLHWPFAPDLIRPFIPGALELDPFEGTAWIGLAPFEIHGTPLLPYFPETNLRTYVVGPRGQRGVWFFSLEAARLAAVIGARAGYHLRYFWARMTVTAENGAIRYRSRRRWPHDRRAMTDLLIQPGEALEASEHDERAHFLTDRFRLYTLARGRLAYAQIEHAPWPLARARVVELRQTLFGSAGLPAPAGDPLVHYSEELAVNIGPLELH